MTGSDIATIVRSLLDEPSSELITDTDILNYLNLVLLDNAALVIKSGNPYYLKEEEITYNNGYFLPSDFWILEDVFYKTSFGDYIAMFEMDTPYYTASGSGIASKYNRVPRYWLVGTEIKIDPAFNNVTLKVRYHRKPDTLSSLSDTIDIPDDIKEVLTYDVAILGAVKGEYSITQLEQLRLIKEKKVKAFMGMNAPHVIKRKYIL